ncbi:MAG: hypothetical protein IPL61_28485 [Myxococcales bacterium]|nr:hypothetical protein [Myxococcales bacterium]
MSLARSLLRSSSGPTAVVAAALLCACGGDEQIVVVHLQARPAVTGVTQLSVVLANASSTQTESFAVSGRSFPLSFSVQTPGRTGDLTIDVVAEDGAGLARGVGGAVIPIGDARVDADVMLEANDFVVNTTYVGSQDLAFRIDGGGRQLSVAPDGVFTIGWSDTCQIVGRCDVFGRRFAPTGVPVDSVIAAGDGQFNINQTDGETGYEPSLASDRTGNTVAAWTTFGELYAVVLSADGDHVTGTETAITTMTSPGTPAVAALPDGRFVVAWTDDGMTAGQTVVKARVLGANGLPVNNPVTNTTDAFVVSTTIRTTDETPAVVALGTGSALAFAWRDGASLRGRFYGVGGTPTGGTDLLLAMHTGDVVNAPQLATLAGDAVLLYRHATASSSQLILRRYTAAGAGVGTPVIVTDDVETGPPALAIAGADVGVGWSACTTASDGDGCGVWFRHYDANLAPLTDALPVNTTTVGDQEEPSIGWLPDRSVAVTWSDGSATAPDRDASAVRARIIYPVAP